MREFQGKKRGLQHILYSRVTVIILAVLIMFLTHATWSVYKKVRESAANVAEAKAEYQKLESRETVLSTEVNRLQTDEGLEEEIRSKYSVLKPGEQVIVIVSDDKATTTPAAKPESWWGKFKGLFK